jgi:hypothetical protein
VHIRQYAKRTNKILSFLTPKSKVQVYNTTQFYQRAKYLSPTELHLNLRTSLSLALSDIVAGVVSSVNLKDQESERQ